YASLLRDSRITILPTDLSALQRLGKEFPWALNSVRLFVCRELPHDSESLAAKIKGDVHQRVFVSHDAVEGGGRWALQPLNGSATGVAPENLTNGRTLHVLDELFQEVVPGVSGELCVGSDAMATGYFHKPSQTAASFIPNPFSSDAPARLYRTGELARRMSDGSIQLIGRRDSRIDHHGRMMFPEEVEAALTQHSSVTHAVVPL